MDRESARLLNEIRDGEGPRFLHAITYRFKGHVSVDAAAYRDSAEVSNALANDPLVIAERALDGAAAARIRKEAEAEVRRAVDVAASAPWPEKREAYLDIQDTGNAQWR